MNTIDLLIFISVSQLLLKLVVEKPGFWNNGTAHSTTRDSHSHVTGCMTFIIVTKSKETELWWKMYWPKKQELVSKAKIVRKPFRFKVGDRVRITYIRNTFNREYDEKWTGKIFEIFQRILRGGLPVYRIKDFNDEEIKGTFYQSELQKTDSRTTIFGKWKGF